MELNPKDADAHFNKGNALNDQEKHTEAIASLKEAVKHNPKHYEAFLNLGNIYFYTKKFEEAITAYN